MRRCCHVPGVVATLVAAMLVLGCAGGTGERPAASLRPPPPAAAPGLRATPGFFAVSGDPGDPGGWAVFLRLGTWREYRVETGDGGLETVETHRYGGVAAPHDVGAVITVPSRALACARGCVVEGGVPGGFVLTAPGGGGGRQVAFTPEGPTTFDLTLAQARAAVQDHNRQVALRDGTPR